MNYLLKAVAIVAAFTASGAALASERSAQSFGPIFVDSLRVQAVGTSGRTAHKVIDLHAGEDRVFLPDSIKFTEASRSGGGRIEARFLEDRYVYANVTTTIDGEQYVIPMPQTIYISMYAETGSGPGNYNRGGWINGHVTARTIEIDH
ncbi:MAG: hypothetical protein AAGF30_05585 [Pseudomonadota bacterium]